MREALNTLAIRSAGAGLAFLLQALLARTMGEFAFGYCAVVWAWILSLGSFASLGLAEVAVRVLPRYSVRNRADTVSGFFAHGFRSTAWAATIFTICGTVLALLLPISADNRAMLLSVCLGLPALALEFFLEGVARAMGWFRLTTVTIYIVRPLMLMALFSGLWLAGFTLTGPLVCALLALTIAVSTCVIWFVMRHRLRCSLSNKKPSKAARRSWRKQSLPMLLASGLDDFLTYIDVVVLGLLLSPALSAGYFVAGRVLTLANLMQYAFTFVAARKFSLSLAGEGVAGTRSHVWYATAQSLLMTTLAVVVTVMAAPLLLRLFGETYVVYMPIVVLLGLAHVARAAAGQTFEFFLLLGRARTLVAVNAVTLAFLFSALVTLVPGTHVVSGGLGAATAYGLAMIVRSAALLALLALQGRYARKLPVPQTRFNS